MMKPDVVKEAYAEVANMETDNGKLRLGFTFSPKPWHALQITTCGNQKESQKSVAVTC